MRAHPIVAILLVIVGVLAFESVLPVWPEVTDTALGRGGLGTRGANLFDAVGSDVALCARFGAMEVLRAIDGAQYLGISIMAAIALGSGWACARYLRESTSDDHEG